VRATPLPWLILIDTVGEVHRPRHVNLPLQLHMLQYLCSCFLFLWLLCLHFCYKFASKSIAVPKLDASIYHDHSYKGIRCMHIRRLTKRHTGKPTQIVKITCTEIDANRLLNTSLIVNNKTCVVDRERKIKVYRCYECQSFGHTASTCKENKRCAFCEEMHDFRQLCTRNVRCCNCGEAHSSSNSKCPVYLTRYETLAMQHPEC